MTECLTVWVIYVDPADFPGKFVLRGQDVYAGDPAVRPHEQAYVNESIEVLRAELRSKGLYCLTRHPEDDAHIVETWI